MLSLCQLGSKSLSKRPAGFSIPDPYVGVVLVVGPFPSPGFHVYTSNSINTSIAPYIPPPRLPSKPAWRPGSVYLPYIYIYIYMYRYRHAYAL